MFVIALMPQACLHSTFEFLSESIKQFKSCAEDKETLSGLDY